MDIPVLLFWVSLLLPAGGLLTAQGRGWALVCGGVMLCGLAEQAVAPDRMPWPVLALWAVAVALPATIARAVARAGWRQNYRQALWLSLGVCLLHPMDGWPASVRLFRALVMLRRGDRAHGEALLRGLASPDRPAPIRLSAQSHLCRMSGDWSPLADGPPPAPADMFAVGLRIRALGECGRLEEMTHAFAAAHPAFRAALFWRSILLPVFAFAGRPAAVATLGRGGLRAQPADTIAFWLALARIAAGGTEVEAGRTALEQLARTAAPDLAHAASFRFAHPPAAASALSVEAQATLDRAEADLPAAKPWARPRLSRIRATLGLTGLILAGYAAEMATGDPDSTETLYRLGALWPQAVTVGGQWWRLPAALFLHAGPIHLGLNLLALLFLGLIAEPMFGRWRYLAIYAGTGLGSMASVLALMRFGLVEPGVLVGASGALMGLVGAIAATFAIRLWRVRPDAARRRLRAMGFVVVLQGAIDLTTPHVSFAAHASGLAIGAVFGLLPWFRRHAAPPPPAEAAVGRALTRRSLGAQIFVGAVLGTAVWLRARAPVTPFGPRHVTAIPGTVLAGLRRLRFVPLEVVADRSRARPPSPSVNPWTPFGSPDPLADLTAIAGPGEEKTLYATIMDSLALFCVRARLDPATYEIPGEGAFAFTAEHAALIRFLVWRVVDPGSLREIAIAPNDLPPPPGRPWPVAIVDPRRPYGDSDVFALDMADILGVQFARGPAGEALLPADVLDRMKRLHAEMPIALRVFALYARLPRRADAAPR